jgi:hypothetical protein
MDSFDDVKQLFSENDKLILIDLQFILNCLSLLN